MNVSEFLLDMRRILDDPADAPVKKFSDADLIAYTDLQLKSLARIQTQRDQGYHNCPLVLRGSEARQVIRDVWQWTLPVWVSNIVSVREMILDEETTRQQTFTPHMWADPASLGAPLEKKSKRYDTGWNFDGNRTFQMWGWGGSYGIFLHVAKAPARLFKAVLDENAPEPGTDTERPSIFLPATLVYGVEDANEGAYVNADVQVSGLATPTTNGESFGAYRRCIYSKAGQIVSGSRRTQLYFETPWPETLLAGDTVESLIPIQDEHVRVLQLKVAWSCFERLANLPAQKAIAASLADEMRMFSEHVTPRDTVLSESWHEPRPTTVRSDYNHDRVYPRYWT